MSRIHTRRGGTAVKVTVAEAVSLLVLVCAHPDALMRPSSVIVPFSQDAGRSK